MILQTKAISGAQDGDAYCVVSRGVDHFQSTPRGAGT